VRKADNLTPSCAVVTKSGNLNFLEPSGPVQACNGTALPYLYHHVQKSLAWLSPNRNRIRTRYLFMTDQGSAPFPLKKKRTIVTNQELSTFPVHRAQSAYLIKHAWNKTFLKKSRWQTISYLRCAPSYTEAVPSIYAIHKNPSLEYIQSQQNQFYRLTPCIFTFVICSSVLMCQRWPASGVFRDV